MYIYVFMLKKYAECDVYAWNYYFDCTIILRGMPLFLLNMIAESGKIQLNLTEILKMAAVSILIRLGQKMRRYVGVNKDNVLNLKP